MTIVEATKKSLETGKWIYRESVFDIDILPTNKSHHFLIKTSYMDASDKGVGKMWNPSTSDILADDWNLRD